MIGFFVLDRKGGGVSLGKVTRRRERFEQRTKIREGKKKAKKRVAFVL